MQNEVVKVTQIMIKLYLLICSLAVLLPQEQLSHFLTIFVSVLKRINKVPISCKNHPLSIVNFKQESIASRAVNIDL